MKTPQFLLFGVPILVVILAVSYVLTRPHLQRHAGPAKVDEAATSTNQPAVGDSSTPGGRMRFILGQLNLTDAQKMQIAQIRQNTTDHQQRRAAIMNVLTPEQRAKFQQLRTAAGAPPPPAPAP